MNYAEDEGGLGGIGRKRGGEGGGRGEQEHAVFLKVVHAGGGEIGVEEFSEDDGGVGGSAVEEKEEGEEEEATESEVHGRINWGCVVSRRHGDIGEGRWKTTP